jgi:hypothetical protein
MNLSQRFNNLLSRKFLAPILAIASFFIWKLFLPSVPIDVYALFVGTLFTSFIAVEGIKDIILTIEQIVDKQK